MIDKLSLKRFNNKMGIYLFAILSIYALFRLISGKEINNPFINLFKAHFPSWKFFDDCEHTPLLFCAFLKSNGTWSDWEIILKPQKPRWYQFFFNPEINLYLAYHSLILQFISDLLKVKTDTEVEELISFQLIKRFALLHAKKNHASSFKLKLTQPETLEDIIESKSFEVSYA